MSSQEEVDLRALNLKDDEASTQGTLAVRYLVRKLQEAKTTNPALAPMVQALMKEQEDDKGNEIKEGERGNSSMQESSQKWRSSTPLNHSPKRQHTVSSGHSSSRSGRSARGRFYRSRSHKSPPILSRREVESSSHERSAGPSPPPRREVRSKRKQRRRSPSPPLRRDMHER